MIDKRFLSRHTLWHLRGMLRFVRKHPERLLRAPLAARSGTNSNDDDRAELRASVAEIRVELVRDECRVDLHLDAPRHGRHRQEDRVRLAGLDRHARLAVTVPIPGWSNSFTPTGPTVTMPFAGGSSRKHAACRESATLTNPRPSPATS